LAGRRAALLDKPNRFKCQQVNRNRRLPVVDVPLTILSARRSRRLLATAAGLAALMAVCNAAQACDGKSYAFSIAVGANVEGGGLTVRLDKAKFIDEKPDKYYVSVKDDGNTLADHIPLKQFDTISLKTRCGTVSIGADRKSMFSNHTLALTWSYF
jgi:hypothetical protein